MVSTSAVIGKGEMKTGQGFWLVQEICESASGSTSQIVIVARTPEGNTCSCSSHLTCKHRDAVNEDIIGYLNLNSLPLKGSRGKVKATYTRF